MLEVVKQHGDALLLGVFDVCVVLHWSLLSLRNSVNFGWWAVEFLPCFDCPYSIAQVPFIINTW